MDGPTFTDYTEDDWQAWLADNPWDQPEDEAWIPDTIGFQAHVLRRRLVEATDELLDAIDDDLRPLALRLLAANTRLARLRAWWWLKRLQLRHWWQNRRYRG